LKFYFGIKFYLFSYWLQSYIYQLQYNTNFPSIERCASILTEYFTHSKSPEDVNHNILHEFSKYMLNSYHSNSYWNKAERLTREEPSKSNSIFLLNPLTIIVLQGQLSKDKCIC
jgi:hypothetical protein